MKRIRVELIGNEICVKNLLAASEGVPVLSIESANLVTGNKVVNPEDMRLRIVPLPNR